MKDDSAILERLLCEARARGDETDSNQILEMFLKYVETIGLTPYAAQEEAILALLEWKHVILSTPTGSGKSLVALALHFQAMAEGRVSFYTAPTKALVNEKFFALCDVLGASNVGLLTGDASVNRDAPIVCCTAEILANMALRDDDVDVDYVVMDEFHYYGDRDRGTAWQVPLITMRDSVFLLMSATLGDTEQVERRLFEFTGREVAVVRGSERPVPLVFEYRETVLHETVEALVRDGQSPLYLVNFTQRDCAEQAQSLMSINVCSKEEKQAIGAQLEGVRFDTLYGKEFQRFLRHGIGVHHAGLLPKYRRVVERLAQLGLVKVISGTDTLGVGVNIPIRTVLLSQLYKYDGEKTAILSAREFHQIAGRAGRKGFDDLGRVVVQAPEWVIENRKLEAKVAKNPHLRNKIVKRKPPPRAMVWDAKTFERLKNALPEALEPRFDITHGMIVNLLRSQVRGPGGGFGRLVDLIARSHGTVVEKRARLKLAATLMRALRKAGLVELRGRDSGRAAEFVVSEELQEDFSLNHALSLYLIEAIGLLDPQAEDHALRVLSLVEAILEDPRPVLFKQVDRLKGELIGRLKAEGVEYEERMEQLEKVEHPKPDADFIYETFDIFAGAHPWVGAQNIRPKSIAREMFETCAGFNDYVSAYGLERSEGVLLRYLSQAYKTAVQNVPTAFWTDAFEDVLAYLHGIVMRVDASLVEEWVLLMAGPREEEGAGRTDTTTLAPSIADDPRALRARVRNELWVLLGALARRDFEAASELVHHSEGSLWSPEELEGAMARCFEALGALDLTPRARQSRNTVFKEEERRRWLVHHEIAGAREDDRWSLECVVDLRRQRDETGPLIELLGVSG